MMNHKFGSIDSLSNMTEGNNITPMATDNLLRDIKNTNQTRFDQLTTQGSSGREHYHALIDMRERVAVRRLLEKGNE